MERGWKGRGKEKGRGGKGRGRGKVKGRKRRRKGRFHSGNFSTPTSDFLATALHFDGIQQS
jgi:hypothetical protein